MRTQTTRTISGEVSNGGALNVCNDSRVSARRTSAGTYALVFPGMRALAVVAGPSGPWPGSFSAWANRLGNEWQVLTSNPANTGVDCAFNFTATVAA